MQMSEASTCRARVASLPRCGFDCRPRQSSKHSHTALPSPDAVFDKQSPYKLSLLWSSRPHFPKGSHVRLWTKYVRTVAEAVKLWTLYSPFFKQPYKLPAWLLTSLAISLLLTNTSVAAIDPVSNTQEGLVPFSINHRSDVESKVDVSFLLKAPAGEHGFITVNDGHLVDAEGDRFRIWGVNLTGWNRGSTNLPPKSEAEHWAKVLAQNGINCVRFHFLDLPTHTPEKAEQREQRRLDAASRGHRNSVAPDGLIDDTKPDTQTFDSAAIDRLDYFIFQLKQVGVYSNLNLNVGRQYREGDDVPDHDLIWVAKGYTYIGERLIELQKDYAQKLLTHFNPYTKSTYCEEPAIATVELVNENSIVEFWLRNWLRGELAKDKPHYQLDFTPFYEQQLTAMYNDWLTKNRSQKEIAQLKAEAGVTDTEPMPRLRRGDFTIASNDRFHAEAEFMIHVEGTFMSLMKDYLKNELGVKSLVIGTADHTYWIPNQPLITSNEQMDFIDAHVYWQHPAIWGKRNTPMVNDPFDSTIVKLSRSAMVGKPLVVSEVNHPNPNDYASEMIPFLASYAAFQDWDGIYFYTFEPKVGEGWDPYAFDQFDITLDPVKMTQMKTGALIFSRADVSPYKKLVTRSFSQEQVYETMRLPEKEAPYFTPGFPLETPLLHGSRIQSLHKTQKQSFPAPTETPYRSDTNELYWNPKSGETGVFTVDTPYSQALVGFLAENAATTFHLKPELRTEFAAITLSSLTEEPIQRSDKLLLVACSRWENTGVVWNERHTLWDDWGHGPTLIETVKGYLMLRELDGAVGLLVTPLDGSGQPLTDTPLQGRRMEKGWEIEIGLPDYPTTQYLIEVIR